MNNPEIKLKPWGREVWFAHTEKYAGKILEVKKGKRLSLQYHKQKMETQYVVSGLIKFTVGPDKEHLEEKILQPGDKYDIYPGLIHRVEALEDSVVFEVSTPELDDVTRLDDDYGRPDQGNHEEIDRKLATEQS